MKRKVVTFDGPCTCCNRALGKRHKRGCKFGVEGMVGISGNMSLRRVGITVFDGRKRNFIPDEERDLR